MRATHLLIFFLLLSVVAARQSILGIHNNSNNKLHTANKNTQQPAACPRYPQPVPLDTNDALIVKALSVVDYYLNQQVQSMNIPGLMAVVVYDQDIIWHNEYGLQDPTNSSSGKPTIDSVVQVASITKVFTSMMMLQLRDNGVVGQDDYVTKYMPSFSMKDPFSTKRQITLRQLASHTSGLPREVPCDWMNFCTEEEVLANLTRMSYLTPPYSLPHYSNLGLALLGRTLEKAANQDYEDYVYGNILKPLSMYNSGFDYEALAHLTAKGMFTLPNGSVVVAPFGTQGWGNPMGGMLASPGDMAKFMSFLFRGGNSNDSSQVIDFSTVREYLSPLSLTNDGLSAFGLPWEFEYDNSNQVWLRSKAGQLLGYRSQVATVPEIKLGVFITATCGNVDDSTQSIFTVPVMDILLPAVLQVLWASQSPIPLPPTPQIYTGVYLLDDTIFNTFTFEVVFRNNAMYGFYGYGEEVMTLDLSWAGENSFRIIDIEGNNQTCRWIDDGVFNELIYFIPSTANSSIFDSLIVMGQMFYLTTNSSSLYIS